LQDLVKRILLVSSIILSAALGVCFSPACLGAQPPAGGSLTAERDEAAAERRQRTFEIVWETVRDKHYDPALNGVDWAEVRRRYAPEVARLTADGGLYPLLNRMLDELGQSHFGVMRLRRPGRDHLIHARLGGRARGAAAGLGHHGGGRDVHRLAQGQGQAP
jgi:hypothetical protein